jgi:hypothetical protein
LARLRSYQMPAEPPPIQPAPGRLGHPSRPGRKSNKTGMYVALGVAGVALVGGLIWWASLPDEDRQRDDKSAPTQEEATVTADVKLTDSQKRKLYNSLMTRKEMLRPMGAEANAYNTLAQEYKISVQGVHSVEAEGKSKHWPKN